jgi:hypothetical protein
MNDTYQKKAVKTSGKSTTFTSSVSQKTAVLMNTLRFLWQSDKLHELAY